MRDQKDSSKNSRNIWTVLMCICLVGAAACLLAMGCGKAREKRAEEEMEALSELTSAEAGGRTGNGTEGTGEEAGMRGLGMEGLGMEGLGAEGASGPEDDGPTPLEQDMLFLEAQGIPIPDKSIDFAALQAEANSDIYAWIHVPDTKIDYPVLQHASDNTYYLNYNMDGSKGYPGCIYTENDNAKDFTDFNTVLYGHNMKDGSMFANLHKFEDADFFAEHPYVYVYTEERLLVYEVFASYEFSNAHLLRKYDVGSEIGISEYLEDVKDVRDMGRNIREELFPDAGSHIITLSTCIRNKPDNRYLVQGVLLNED